MQHFEFGFEQMQERTGHDLFRSSRALARQCKQRFPGQPLLPSGARIWYYTLRLLLVRDALPEVNPDEAVLPAPVIERFLQAAPRVAEWLVSEYPLAVRLRAALERTRRPMSLDGRSGELQQLWERLVGTSWRGTNQDQLARLLALLRSDRLCVAPVARPDDSPPVALRLLRAQLAQDAERGWQVPSAEAYLYDEPLEGWLLRSLLT